MKTKLSLAWGLLMLSMSASAVTVDGIRTQGDGYTNSFAVNWHNDHNASDSIYNIGQGLITEVFWATSGGDFYLYVAVPLEAKNLMWGGALLGDAAELDAYFYENSNYHHSLDNVDQKAQFGTMTGSEKIEWGSNSIDLDSSSDNGLWSSVATSLDWVLANGCSTASCDRKDIPMGFEFKFDNFSMQDIQNLIADMQSESIVFHLSDERQGDVTFAPVPVPGAVWLFASALIGLRGLSKKKNV